MYMSLFGAIFLTIISFVISPTFSSSPEEDYFIRLSTTTLKALLTEAEARESRMSKEGENLVIDHSHERICDVNLNLKGNGSYPKHYSVVLDDLQRPINVTSSKLIDLHLQSNYLEDEGVGAITEFILRNDFLKNNLRVLDLSHNRFTKTSLPTLRSLVESCPNLEALDISINYVGVNDFDTEFSKLSSPLLSKVIFSVY